MKKWRLYRLFKIMRTETYSLLPLLVSSTPWSSQRSPHLRQWPVTRLSQILALLQGQGAAMAEQKEALGSFQLEQRNAIALLSGDTQGLADSRKRGTCRRLVILPAGRLRS